jgi:N-acetylmuramoyl-L-alanine amidase
MPSVLVETGFLTNSSEGAFLNSSKGQNQMAVAIAKAIINYKNEREAGVNKEVITEVKPESEVPSSSTSSDLVFKVQIAASKNRIATKPYNFKGLSSVSREKNGKLYRYFYKSSSSYEEAKDHLVTAKNKGYSKAFIVAYDGDKKITISEAQQLIK